MLGEQFQRLRKTDMLQFATRFLVFTTICGLAVAQNESQYYGNPSSLLFPGPINSQIGKTNVPTERKEDFEDSGELVKSLKLAEKINSIETIKEFLSLVQDVPETDKTFFVNSRFGEGEGEERSNAQFAVPAKCMPELQPVPLKHDDDTSTMYFPPCTRVMRCGGCCNHALLSCQPTATEIQNFEVFVVSIDKSTTLSHKEKRIVPMEVHTKCKCDCKIKAEHCTEKQSYVREECRCVCNNVDEAEKCAQNDMKWWDPDHCTCHCKHIETCSSSHYFDHNTCRCREIPFSRPWFALSNGANYKFGQTEKPEKAPPVIVALDATDPRRKPKDDPEYK